VDGAAVGSDDRAAVGPDDGAIVGGLGLSFHLGLVGGL
jgi:hypothetical protein